MVKTGDDAMMHSFSKEIFTVLFKQELPLISIGSNLFDLIPFLTGLLWTCTYVLEKI